MNQINITPKDISRIFWELIYGTEENFSPLDRANLLNTISKLDILRDKIDLLKSHYLIMPPNEKILNDHRFKTTSSTAVIVPMKTFTLAVSH
ncbi:MAG: hypothetical protein P8K73_04615 [Methylophilaceae bacterium]|nr:hypothetical protein [Methylophilaceae bacterium]